jgi:hypothetical protein
VRNIKSIGAAWSAGLITAEYQRLYDCDFVMRAALLFVNSVQASLPDAEALSNHRRLRLYRVYNKKRWERGREKFAGALAGSRVRDEGRR